MDLRRQTDIIKTDEIAMLPILIVGAGSIGSYTTLALAKMGARRITVMDFDRLEEHNIPNQFYKMGDVGKYKVSALADNIFDLTGALIDGIPRKFEDNNLNGLGGIIIAATDNMAARQQIYNAIKTSGTKLRYIDARMATLSLEIFNIQPQYMDDRELYEAKLFPDEESTQIPCTARGVVYPVMTCAAIIANMVRNHVMELPSKRRVVMDYSQDFYVTED